MALLKLNLGEEHLIIALYVYAQTNCLCFHDWLNWINKVTLKDNTVPYCFILFVVDPAIYLA